MECEGSPVLSDESASPSSRVSAGQACEFFFIGDELESGWCTSCEDSDEELLPALPTEADILRQQLAVLAAEKADHQQQLHQAYDRIASLPS